MSYQYLTCRIRGLSPTIMHNGQLADPMNEWSEAIKEITSKKTKTKADFDEMHRLEWYGSLYIDENGAPCWPGENVEAMIKAAARKSRQGKDVDCGIIVMGNLPLIYDGPKVPDELWPQPQYRSIVCCVNPSRKTRVMRCRPIFPKWELEFTVGWLPEVVNRSDLELWLQKASVYVGLSDWRPKYGRFEIVAMSR